MSIYFFQAEVIIENDNFYLYSRTWIKRTEINIHTITFLHDARVITQMNTKQILNW